MALIGGIFSFNPLRGLSAFSTRRSGCWRNIYRSPVSIPTRIVGLFDFILEQLSQRDLKEFQSPTRIVGLFDSN